MPRPGQLFLLRRLVSSAGVQEAHGAPPGPWPPSVAPAGPVCTGLSMLGWTPSRPATCPCSHPAHVVLSPALASGPPGFLLGLVLLRCLHDGLDHSEACLLRAPVPMDQPLAAAGPS